MKYVIYKIENIITGDLYIGKANSFSPRRRDHLYRLKKGIHKSKLLQEHYNRDGESCFFFVILEQTEKPQYLLKKEGKWIKKLQPVYNTYKG
jgi:group I intron endonuclease